MTIDEVTKELATPGKVAKRPGWLPAECIINRPGVGLVKALVWSRGGEDMHGCRTSFVAWAMTQADFSASDWIVVGEREFFTSRLSTINEIIAEKQRDIAFSESKRKAKEG